jgi:hypothetical protein
VAYLQGKRKTSKRYPKDVGTTSFGCPIVKNVRQISND